MIEIPPLSSLSHFLITGFISLSQEKLVSDNCFLYLEKSKKPQDANSGLYGEGNFQTFYLNIYSNLLVWREIWFLKLLYRKLCMQLNIPSLYMAGCSYRMFSFNCVKFAQAGPLFETSYHRLRTYITYSHNDCN